MLSSISRVLARTPPALTPVMRTAPHRATERRYGCSRNPRDRFVPGRRPSDENVFGRSSVLLKTFQRVQRRTIFRPDESSGRETITEQTDGYSVTGRADRVAFVLRFSFVPLLANDGLVTCTRIRF